MVIMEKWIAELIDKHIDTETGALDKEAFAADYSTEAPKRVVPKSVFNEKNEELKDARETLEELNKTDNTEELKGKLEEYETKLTELQTERKEERKALAIKESLKDTVDPNFVATLLKDKVEFDEESGELKGFEEALKEHREQQPYLFKDNEPEIPKVDDKQLANPQGSALTSKDIVNMGNRAERLEAIKNNPHLFKRRSR